MSAMSMPEKGAVIESVLMAGDIAKLSQEERVAYYVRVCESVGLNPLTRPFEYIVLNNRLTLYARKDATDQLRSLHNISVVDMTESERDGAYIVTAKVQNGDGRTDIAKGAVNIAGLKGEALANALMKAETKAKRRATLSICGLGLLDETEIETVPDAQPVESQKIVNPETGRLIDPNSSNQLRKSGAWDSFVDKIQHYRDVGDLAGLQQWYASEAVNARIGKWPPSWREQAHAEFQAAFDAIDAAEKQRELAS